MTVEVAENDDLVAALAASRSLRRKPDSQEQRPAEDERQADHEPPGGPLRRRSSV